MCVEGCTAVGDNRFKVCMQFKTDGKAAVEAETVVVKNASYVEIYTGIYTAFKYADLSRAEELLKTRITVGWDALCAEHQADFSEMMSRSDIVFEYDKALDELSISDRLERLKKEPEAVDNGLLSLYWQFGKYLLVSSSRPGTLPANLQGVWADGLKSPWDADYHTNIN